MLSYRYIGASFSAMNTAGVDPRVLIRHDMRNTTGGIMWAPLSITCPGGGGGKSDLEAVPNPVIHSLQILDDARDVKWIEVLDSTTLKSGRRFGYGRATIVDADDHSRVIALVESQSTVIGDVPEGLERFDDDPIMHIEDSQDLPPLWQVFGGSKREDGRWVLPPLHLELASPDGALHLGPQHIILETAATDLGERGGGNRSTAGVEHPRDAPVPGQGRPFPGRGRCSSGRPRPGQRPVDDL